MSFHLDEVSSTHYKWAEEINDQLETELNKIEVLLKKNLGTLENLVTLHPSEETAEETPPVAGSPLLKTAGRIMSKLKLNAQAEDLLVKENNRLRKQLNHLQRILDEVEMERDVLLQQVHAYLAANSSLRVRLEEQRCQAGALQKQMCTDLELRIKSLESEKEQLADSNLEKDQKIQKIALTLEETLKSMKNRETEILNRKNKDKNLVCLLKADLKKALEEKVKTEEKYANLKERVEDYFSRRNAGERGLRDRKRKRSLSVGDLRRASLGFLEKNIFLKLDQDCSTQELFKTPQHVEGSWNLHASRSWPQGVTSAERVKNTPVQTQLNSLRRDLLQVTRKLEALKITLVSSRVIPEEPTPPRENRSLKRKANSVEEGSGDVPEEHKSEFKNLKNILQDAKNLNAKLQNLREEKQKIIDSNKAEGGVQVAEKENEFSQTAHEVGPPVGVFKTR